MPLLALDTAHPTAVLVDATHVDDAEWAAIWRQRTGDRLRCRSCGGPVHAKQRRQSGLRFFAHTQTPDDCPTARETARHLELKSVFAAAFRAAGWPAELEVAGDGWRTDVLGIDPDKKVQFAVEIQLSSIDPDLVTQREKRHAAAGVSTLWVVETLQRAWATKRPTVLVHGSHVIDTVLIPATGAQAASADSVTVAGPSSIDRFVRRLTEGRIAPLADRDRDKLLRLHVSADRAFQLDGCADAAIQRQRILDASRAASRAAHRARQQEEIEQRLVARQAANALMQESLEAFVEWFAPDGRKYAFRPRQFVTPSKAAESHWNQDFGIVIQIGFVAITHVLAVAEPRTGISPDRRVAAWTIGRDPTTDTSAFSLVLTPNSSIDDIPSHRDLKRVVARSRRR